MNYEVLETDLEEMKREYRDRLRFTGASAVEQVTGRGDILDQPGAVAYLDVPQYNSEDNIDEILYHEDWEVPGGDQELYIILSDFTPSAFPMGEIKLAETDVMIEDYRRASPRKFAHELQNDKYFQRFLNDHLSSLKKEELAQSYDDVEMPWT